MTPLDFINDLRQVTNADELYEGKCREFSKWLRTFFPEGEVYCDCNHVITKIDGKFYDVTGEVEQGNKIPAHMGCGQCDQINI
jgi:hypothetical protein